MPEIEDFLKLPLETQRRQLKRLVYETVPEGEVKETATAIGVEAYTLYKMRDGNEVKYNLLRPELLKIIHLRQDYRLLDFLEHLLGRVAYTIPKSSADQADINRAATEVISGSANYLEAVTDLVDAMDNDELMFDHQWDAELKDVEVACRRLQAKAEALLHMVRLVRGGARVVKLGTKRRDAK
jgi:hypothetical protein